MAGRQAGTYSPKMTMPKGEGARQASTAACTLGGTLAMSLPSGWHAATPTMHSSKHKHFCTKLICYVWVPAVALRTLASMCTTDASTEKSEWPCSRALYAMAFLEGLPSSRSLVCSRGDYHPDPFRLLCTGRLAFCVLDWRSKGALQQGGGRRKHRSGRSAPGLSMKPPHVGALLAFLRGALHSACRRDGQWPGPRAPRTQHSNLFGWDVQNEGLCGARPLADCTAPTCSSPSRQANTMVVRGTNWGSVCVKQWAGEGGGRGGGEGVTKGVRWLAPAVHCVLRWGSQGCGSAHVYGIR